MPEQHDFDLYEGGDATADDDRLEGFLESMAEIVDSAALKHSRERTNAILGAVRGAAIVASKAVIRVFRFVQDQLLGGIVERAKANRTSAEAEVLRGEADKRRADARAIETESKAAATKTKAEAAAIQISASADLLEQLHNAGLDFEATIEGNGKLRIAVTKRNPEGPADDDSEPPGKG